jgi:hypothetical protein
MSRKYIPNSRQQKRFSACAERWRRIKHLTGVSRTQFFKCCLSKPRAYGSIFRISPMPPCGIFEPDDGSPEVVWADVWVDAVRLDDGNEYTSVTVTWVVGPGNITVPLYDPFKKVEVKHYARSQIHSTGILDTQADAEAWFKAVADAYRLAIADEIAARATPQP